MTRGSAALVVAALVGLSGCGDGDDSADTSSDDVGTVTDEQFLGHGLREIPSDDAPTLQLDIQADEHGGWNLQLQTENFTFTPEQTNGQAHAQEGHVHVYVDEIKFSRAYSEWLYLPASVVGSGEHTVQVTLNADDHTIWTVDGEPIVATATITATDDGHSPGDDHEHSDDDNPADETPTSTADVELTVDIADGQADPPLEQHSVDHGATVRIVVTSDQPDEVHLHGYDVTTDIGPEAPGVIEFVADQTGRFELETHDTNLVLLDLLVR